MMIRDSSLLFWGNPVDIKYVVLFIMCKIFYVWCCCYCCSSIIYSQY